MSRLLELFPGICRDRQCHLPLAAGLAGFCLLVGCSGSSGPAPVTNEAANSDGPASAPAAPSISRSDPESMYGDAGRRSAPPVSSRPPVSGSSPREIKVIPSKAEALGVAFSPDGTQIAGACFDGYFRIWSVPDGSLSAEIACPFGRAEEVCYSPDGKFIVGGSRRGGVWLIDPVSQKTDQLIELKDYVVALIRFTPDLKQLAICWRGGRTVLVSPQGEVTFDVFLKEKLRNVDVSPDGSELAICPEQGEIRFYRVADGQQVDTLDPQIPAKLGEVAYIGNQRLAVSGLDGQVTVWDRTSKQRVLSQKLEYWPWCVETHPDQRRLLLGTSTPKAGGVYVWDQVNQPLLLPGLAVGIRSIAWDPSGRLAAAGAKDKSIHIWEVGAPQSTVEPLNQAELAALVDWNQRLEKASDAKWSQYEEADKKLVEQTLRDFFSAAKSEKVADIQKKALEMMISKAEVDRYFRKTSADVWPLCREFRDNLSDAKQIARAKRSGEIEELQKTKMLTVNLRTGKPSPGVVSLLNMLPNDLRVYNVFEVDGLKRGAQRDQIATFIVDSDNKPRMLPGLDEIASELEHQGKLAVPQLAAKPSIPLSEAGKSYLGQKTGQRRDDNGLKLPLRWCPAGKFRMGTDPKNTPDYIDVSNENPVDVTLSAGFWMGENEVTQGQWKAVMGTEPWKFDSDIARDADMPATHITWELAQAFCRKLTQQERQAKRLPEGWEYNLPTEAQWEYTCRAGTTDMYYFGSVPRDLADYGWYRKNAQDPKTGNPVPHKVGVKKTNAWGIHDMLGNVEEWCRDYYRNRRVGGTDPLGPSADQEQLRVVRGGHYFSDALYCRCAARDLRVQTNEDVRFTTGFRVAIVRSTE